MAAHDDEIRIRPIGDEDRERALWLAQLDTKRALEGRLLGASVGGRLVAAISIESGDSVADPFVPSAHARAMLKLRASQLNARDRRMDGRGRLLRRRGRRARATLPASPPGAGGRLLALARRSQAGA